MADYDPQRIEAKWRKVWAEQDAFRAVDNDSSRPKYYLLEMLPYPSGTLHMGHMRNYTIGDAVARYKCMRGFNVLHPIGWDAFGLPAENAAIKRGIPPREWTNGNIAQMKAVCERFGFSYDWRAKSPPASRNTIAGTNGSSCACSRSGLAYRKRSRVNWCPQCLTVLANEQVVDGYLLAARHNPRRIERNRTVVFAHHEILRRAAGGYWRARRRLARARPDHAAELDREIARRAGAI